jgi:elongation factor P
MSTVDVGQLKRGKAIIVDGAPTLIVSLQFVKPGKGQALYKCRLKNLNSGNSYEKTFRTGDKFEGANVTQLDMQYLYKDGPNYNFMNQSTFEQVFMPESDVGNDAFYLKEGLDLRLVMLGERPIEIELPNFVRLLVKVAENWVKGDTSSGATMPVEMETGLILQVPLFIHEGDLLRIDTRTGDYVERVKK